MACLPSPGAHSHIPNRIGNASPLEEATIVRANRSSERGQFTFMVCYPATNLLSQNARRRAGHTSIFLTARKAPRSPLPRPFWLWTKHWLMPPADEPLINLRSWSLIAALPSMHHRTSRAARTQQRCTGRAKLIGVTGLHAPIGLHPGGHCERARRQDNQCVGCSRNVVLGLESAGWIPRASGSCSGFPSRGALL